MKDMYRCLNCGYLEAVDELPTACEKCGSSLLQIVEGRIKALPSW